MTADLIKTREEDNALKYNKGIIAHSPAHMMSLDEISFSFMAGFNALLESQPEESLNKQALTVLRIRLKTLGVLVPDFEETEHAFPLTKDDLLTLTGQIQIHSTHHKYNNGRRKAFKETAALLRKYLNYNYELTSNPAKRNKKSKNPQPPVESVENASND